MTQTAAAILIALKMSSDDGNLIQPKTVQSIIRVIKLSSLVIVFKKLPGEQVLTCRMGLCIFQKLER